MEVKPVVAVVTQKLTDTLNDESVADNKVMIHQLKGVQKSLKKLQSFSQEKDVSDASRRAKEHLRVAYECEDEIEKFTFRIAKQRKKFGFLMKRTFFFKNLNSCRRLTRNIKKIQTQISSSCHDQSVTTNSSSEDNSVTTISDDPIGEECDCDDDTSYEKNDLTQKSSSFVGVTSNIPSSPSFKRGVYSRSFTMIPHPEKIQMASLSYQDEELSIIGLNDDIRSLVKWLTQQHDMNVSRFIGDFNIPLKKSMRKNEMFVRIVGELGSGKTTLARAVYRNRRIKDHFEIRDWISVTEDYTAERILYSVSKKLGLVNENGNQSQENNLQGHLKGKKYLIVIDGVGSRDVVKVKNLIDAFPDENNGSKVIFTSRQVWKYLNSKINPHTFPDENNGSKVIFTSREVWEHSEMKINQHVMKLLNETESWKLFLNKSGKAKKADQIQSMAKDRILIICRGLPLNIVLISGLLSAKSIKRWSSVIARDQGANDVLRLCYNDLHIQLKLCLLYLSLFPKDYNIPIRRLLRLWLAEGFVKRKSQEKSPEDLVQRYFDKLVDRNMIEITKSRSDNSPKNCRLVPVFHDYLLPKAQDISLFYIRRNSENVAGPFGVRRMVQYVNTTGVVAVNRRAHGKKEDISQHFDPSLLRSYVSFNFQRKDVQEKEVGILLGGIINGGFGLLRVLDLEGVYKPNLPHKLGHLCHLRYLGLRRTFLDSIPESVGELSYLETLDVKHTYVDTLPDSIWKLKNLRHLNLNNIRLAMPPSSSSTLLTLWGLVLDEKVRVNECLGKLRDLRELGIKFTLPKSQEVLIEWIAKLENLQSLRLISVDDKGHPSNLDLPQMDFRQQLGFLHCHSLG